MKYRYSYTTSDDLIDVNIDRIEIRGDKEKIDLIIDLADIIDSNINITIDCKKLTDLNPCQGYCLRFTNKEMDLECEVVKIEGYIKITTHIINASLIRNINKIILLANLVLNDKAEDMYI